VNSAVVLDASALIALMAVEPGAAAVAAVLPGALISAANLAEVVSKFAERGMPAQDTHADALALGIEVVSLDGELAREVGALQPLTRPAGLSLGDRCCLALALRRRATALTTEVRWAAIANEIGVAIRNIRPGRG
jgi:ribonuclease VapC